MGPSYEFEWGALLWFTTPWCRTATALYGFMQPVRSTTPKISPMDQGAGALHIISLSVCVFPVFRVLFHFSPINSPPPAYASAKPTLIQRGPSSPTRPLTQWTAQN